MSNARNLARLQPNASGQLPDAAMSSGSVLQVINVFASGTTTVSSGTPAVLSGMSASITVQANSKVLVITRAGAFGSNSSGWASTGRVFLYKDGSGVAISEHMGAISMSEQCYTHVVTHLTSSLAAGTYTFDTRGNSTTGGSISFNRDGSSMGNMILMEIAA